MATDSKFIYRIRRLQYDKQTIHALSELIDYLEFNPDDLIVRVELAILYFTLNLISEMDDELDFIIAKSPKTAEDYNAYGMAYALYGYTGTPAQSKQSWNRALNHFKRSIRLDPNRSDVYRHRAQMYLWMYDNKSAIKDLTRALDFTPDDIMLLILRASQLSELGNKRDAMSDINRAIQLEPSNIDLYMRRSDIRGEKDIKGQIADFTQILHIAPNNIDVLNARALCLMEINKKLALKDYISILKLDSNNYDALSFAAGIYEDLREYERSIKLLNRLITLNPNSSAFYKRRARCYKALKNFIAMRDDNKTAAYLESMQPKSSGRRRNPFRFFIKIFI